MAFESSPGEVRAALPALRARPSRQTQLWRTIRRYPLGTISGVIILLVILAAVFAQVVSPYDPIAVRMGPGLAPPSPQFLMGTDNNGRDLLSRVIYGSRISLMVGFIVVTLGTIGGAIIGVVSGFFGGKLDLLLQRLMDSIMAFPAIILAMSIISVLGANTATSIVAIAIVFIPGNSRVLRGATLSVKENQYIEAAHAMGASTVRILVRHILPNVLAPILVLASVQIGNAILVEASLSFLGLGTQPPTPSWGGMLSGPGRAYMERAPWMASFPGLAISLCVLSFNLLGDALRDALDPRLRGSN